MAGLVVAGIERRGVGEEVESSLVLWRVRSADSEIAVLLFFGHQVEGGVEPLAHDESLSHLEVDLVSVQGLEEDEGDESAERNAVHPDGQKAGAAGVYEVALSDVEQIGSCET